MPDDVRPYPEIDAANPAATPISTDSVVGTADPAGTPLTSNFTFIKIFALLAAYTQTFTNKRVTKRIVTTTQAAAPAINTDNGDIFIMTALAQAITSLTTNLTGTPTDGQMMEMRITDNGTARAITPGASFLGTSEFSLTGLTTTVSKTLKLLWAWSAARSAWELVGKLNQA